MSVICFDSLPFLAENVLNASNASEIDSLKSSQTGLIILCFSAFVFSMYYALNSYARLPISIEAFTGSVNPSLRKMTLP